MIRKPYLLGGTALFLGYVGALLKREERPVSHELMQFHRKEQMRKLKKSWCPFVRLTASIVSN
jgi:hypothetical protein